MRPFSSNFSKPVVFEKTPLELVVFQIRWPRLSGLSEGLNKEANEISLELAEQFPFYDMSNEISFRINQSSFEAETGSPIHNWFNLDRSTKLTLAPTFLTIQTTRYQGLDNFCEIIKKVLKATLNHVSIPYIEREGFRYVNRTFETSNIEKFVVVPLSAALNLGLIPEVIINHSMSDLSLKIGENSLQTRVGVLPPGVTLDPAIESVQQTSWVFDLDAFTEEISVSETEIIVEKARVLSDLAYDFFTSFTTDEFKHSFGAYSAEK